MKQKHRFLLPLLMALVMIAMSPAKVRALDVITASNCSEYGLSSVYDGYYTITNINDLYDWAAEVNKVCGAGWNESKTSGKYNAVLTQDIVVNSNLLKRNAYGNVDITLGNHGEPQKIVPDLNISNPRGWVGPYVFGGTFDGNGHSISGLYQVVNGNKTYLAGFISWFHDGTIKNLTIKDSYVFYNHNNTQTDAWVGGFVGHLMDGKIINCRYEGYVGGTGWGTKDQGGDSQVGGISGYSLRGTIEKCTSQGYIYACGWRVKNDRNQTRSGAGGISGWTEAGNYIACLNEAVVYGRSLASAGGIVGNYYAVGAPHYHGKITNSLNVGTVFGYVAGNMAGKLLKDQNYSYNYYLKNHAWEKANRGLYTGLDGSQGWQPNSLTEEQLATPEYTYLLNGKESGNNVHWRLKIGTDKRPNFTSSEIVYLGKEYLCDDATVTNQYWTNDKSKEHVISGDHDWGNATEYNEDGFAYCKTCHKLYENSKNDYKYCQPATVASDGWSEVYNLGQLLYMSDSNVGRIRLMKDIVFNEHVLNADGTLNGDGSNFYAWRPMCNSEQCPYTGTFDGNGHTISGLYYNNAEADNVGLIAKLACFGQVKNLGIVDSYFRGRNNVGGIVGYMYMHYNLETETTKNERDKYWNHITNCYNAATVVGNEGVGGIVGYSPAKTLAADSRPHSYIENCYNVGKVQGDGIGWRFADSGIYPGTEITNCYTLSGAATNNNYATAATKQQFESGEVCYHLNGDKSTDDVVWRQGIGTDKTPVTDASRPIVIYGANYDCANNKIGDDVYSNTGFGKDTHTATKTDAVLETCDKDGNKEYWFCSKCNKHFKDEACTEEYGTNGWVIAHHHGNIIYNKAVDPTLCTETGNTAYYQCETCQKYYSERACTNEITLASTVTTGDHHTIALSSKLVDVDGKEYDNVAGCTHTGVKRDAYQCSDCHKYFNEEAAENELAESDVIIPATGHGTITHHDAHDATCTTAGNKEYWTCSNEGDVYYSDAECTTLISGSTVIDALGHHADSYTNGFGNCTRCTIEMLDEPHYTVSSNDFYIENAGQLYWFANAINSGSYKDVPGYSADNNQPAIFIPWDITINQNVLKADGTLNTEAASGFRNWTPIGTIENPYTGAVVTAIADKHDYKKTRHHIKGIYCNQPEMQGVGLFGGFAGNKNAEYSDNSMSEVAIMDSYFNGAQYVGAYAGKNTSTDPVSLVFVDNTIVAGTDYVGGIFGQNTGALKNGYSNATIQSTGTHKGAVAGESTADVITNFYCLTDANSYATQKTADAFASGEVAYALDFNQYLGHDAMPCFEHNTPGHRVHPIVCTNCKGQTYYSGYTNSQVESDWVGVQNAHNWVNGTCTICGTTKQIELIAAGETTGTTYTDLATALKNITEGCTLKLTGDFTMTENYDMDGSSAKSFTLDLNGYTIDGHYTKYYDEDINQPYTSYYRLGAEGALTVKNGTLKADINNQDYNNVRACIIDNATVIGNRLEWTSNGGVDIRNNSTLNIDNQQGYGRFYFNACYMDETSKVILTGVNSLGANALVPNGYKDIMHRLKVPAGYKLKQSFSDCYLAFFDENNDNWPASMKGVSITIKGTDPVSSCTYSNVFTLISRASENYANFSNQWHQVCTQCYNVNPEELKYDNGNWSCGNYGMSDNDSYDGNKNFTADKFSYPREVTGGNIVTFVLPAKVPLSQIHGKVWKYATYEEGTFKFTEYTKDSEGKALTEPNVPYLVVLDQDATQLMDQNLENVNICSSEEPTIYGADGVSRHVGTYNTKSIMTDAITAYYGYSKASQKFVKAKTGTLKPFRTMFAIDNPSSQYSTFADWTSTYKSGTNNGETETSLGLTGINDKNIYTFEAKAGDVLTFDWSISAGDYDEFRAFLCDGEPTAENYYDLDKSFVNKYGNSSGKAEKHITEAGTYTVVFTYRKGSSSNDYVRNDVAKATNIRLYTMGTSSSSTSEAKAFVALQLGMDDEPDNIIMVDADAIMGTGSPMYNLQGQRITKPVKGQILIQDGKKVLY